MIVFVLRLGIIVHDELEPVPELGKYILDEIETLTDHYEVDEDGGH